MEQRQDQQQQQQQQFQPRKQQQQPRPAQQQHRQRRHKQKQRNSNSVNNNKNTTAPTGFRFSRSSFPADTRSKEDIFYYFTHGWDKGHKSATLITTAARRRTLARVVTPRRTVARSPHPAEDSLGTHRLGPWRRVPSNRRVRQHGRQMA